MSAESSKTQSCPFLDSHDIENFQRDKYPAYYWWVVLHELLGHGTGRMMVEESENKYNFDIADPPINPLDGKPITSWYRPGQSWTGQFGDLATTVDECRAELVGAYLMDDPELLSLFGFSDTTAITSGDCKFSISRGRVQANDKIVTYNTYLQLGVDGLRGLANFNVDNGVSPPFYYRKSPY